MRSKRKRPQPPEFSSIEEEAEFWDTHDTTGFEWEDLEEDVVWLVGPRNHRIQIRLDDKTYTALRRFARESGTSPSLLASGIVIERLRAETKKRPVKQTTKRTRRSA